MKKNSFTYHTAFAKPAFVDSFFVAKKPSFSIGIYIEESLFSKNRISLIIPLLLFSLFSTAQSIYPSTVNATGQSSSFGNFRFEWSVGESAAINTMSSSNLLVTNGLLQYYVENQPDHNIIANWLPSEVTVYPNPVRNILEINILHSIVGKEKIELFDIKGGKLMEKQFEYTGMGVLEKLNLSGLTAGQYILSIQQISPITGRVFKKGTYKILKIN
jgi:hypothetical protein